MPDVAARSSSTAPALLIVDVQNAIDAPVWGRRGQAFAEANIARLLAVWRERGRPAFHNRHDSVEPESPYRPGQPGNEFKSAVAPLAGEAVIVKQSNSAFIGTGLEARLRAEEISQLVITGVLLENSVDATVRMAGNLGFDVLFPADATASIDSTDRDGRNWTVEEVHALTLSILDGEYGSVVETRQLLDGEL